MQKISIFWHLTGGDICQATIFYFYFKLINQLDNVKNVGYDFGIEFGFFVYIVGIIKFLEFNFKKYSELLGLCEYLAEIISFWQK